MKILTTPRMERCIGCHACSLACARLVHKRLPWDTAGIRILSSGGLSTGFEAKPCLACNPALCAAACPTGAYSQRKSGGVVVKKSLCIRCGVLRCGLSGGCHLSRSDGRAVRVYPLRPLRSVLPAQPMRLH
jgi:Fe-S-cluster-containing dehydrogenase component